MHIYFIFLLTVSFGLFAKVNIEDVISGQIVDNKIKLTDAKLKIIELLAFEAGVFYGRNEQISKFNKSLDKMETYLNEINFKNLLINENMLPPVIVEADDMYEKEDGTSHREIKKIYRMVRKARVSYDVPTWRTYIYIVIDENAPVIPSDFELKGKDEKQTWSHFAGIGVEKGILQANDEIEYQIAIMLRDYQGMLLAHYLNKHGIISFSKLNKFNKGIIVKDGQINIRDMLVVSTNNDKFLETKNWKPLIRKSLGIRVDRDTNTPYIKRVK